VNGEGTVLATAARCRNEGQKKTRVRKRRSKRLGERSVRDSSCNYERGDAFEKPHELR
jgi:hypothetical protein